MSKMINLFYTINTNHQEVKLHNFMHIAFYGASTSYSFLQEGSVWRVRGTVKLIQTAQGIWSVVLITVTGKENFPEVLSIVIGNHDLTGFVVPTVTGNDNLPVGSINRYI